MGPVGYLLAVTAAAAMAAAAPQAGGGAAPVQFICQRDDCTCETRQGLEVVTCDCSQGGDGETLLLGARSNAYLSDRTLSLRVRHCSHVQLVPEALASAISLEDLELSDIARLELQADSLYTDEGRVRRVTVQRVGDLQVDPQAFRKVSQLQQLELTELTAGHLPLDSFAAADVQSLRLADSRAEDVSLGFGKGDHVTVANCTLRKLSVDVGDVLSVTIADNTIKRVDALRINVRDNKHSPDTNNVTIARNTISAMDSEQDVHMVLDRFELVNNTIASLTAPLIVDFATADVTGNDIGQLGPAVFQQFVRLQPLNIRGPSDVVAELAFTFGGNTLRAPANGSYGLFLSLADEQNGQDALYRVYGNRFTCDCEQLQELVRAGEDAGNDDQDGDDLFQVEDVYGELYRTSMCVEDGQKLPQYRQTAYTAELECKEEVTTEAPEETEEMDKTNGAASSTAGVLTLLLATAAATGLTV